MTNYARFVFHMRALLSLHRLLSHYLLNLVTRFTRSLGTGRSPRHGLDIGLIGDMLSFLLITAWLRSAGMHPTFLQMFWILLRGSWIMERSMAWMQTV